MRRAGLTSNDGAFRGSLSELDLRQNLLVPYLDRVDDAVGLRVAGDDLGDAGAEIASVAELTRVRQRDGRHTGQLGYAHVVEQLLDLCYFEGAVASRHAGAEVCIASHQCSDVARCDGQ